MGCGVCRRDGWPGLASSAMRGRRARGGGSDARCAGSRASRAYLRRRGNKAVIPQKADQAANR